ncbi:LytTR family DNA-binding domain-containing protein [Saccharopolyspora sp. NPDC000995]
MGSTRRLVGINEHRRVIFAVEEVALAEAAGRIVWLRTDLGRFRCATDGIDKLDDQLSGCGFMRIHRSYMVNLSRVREVEWKGGGELALSVDGVSGMVPVSRRRAKFFIAALGL